MSKYLFFVGNVVDAGGELSADVLKELADLADELNSGLPRFEVTLVHRDTQDFLCFEERQEADDEPGMNYNPL